MLPSTKLKTLYGFAASSIRNKTEEHLSGKRINVKEEDSQVGKPAAPSPGNDRGLTTSKGY